LYNSNYVHHYKQRYEDNAALFVNMYLTGGYNLLTF